ncbi:DUF742 domain-containing protein [Amycolatopsis cynarae]|uniref:DUF742 domain-containing protein n=1 Tax=Amycolatopsis cynarae TaxID=2995223 RepID=A0ABY7B1U5_9PSEU|nr:DUF742 domain-containing protein [Amycolatopsis sp. HUAS 11-8]WAL66272.1 DUF742 domain-containing protein [Amycolatopsis sp. HUAS 11-8]
MSGLPNRAEGPDIDAWEALHQGTDREALDSPARFTLDRSAVLLRVRSLPSVKRSPAPVTPPPAAVSPQPSAPPAAPPRQAPPRQRTMMRPYAHTRGRTRPDYELALEALVSTSKRGRRYEGAVSAQHRRICDLCAEPRSIAEIAAYLYLPLNVVKVLVSDMDNLELVVIHQPGLSFGDRSSREFMARVLHGLRSL